MYYYCNTVRAIDLNEECLNLINRAKQRHIKLASLALSSTNNLSRINTMNFLNSQHSDVLNIHIF